MKLLDAYPNPNARLRELEATAIKDFNKGLLNVKQLNNILYKLDRISAARNL